LNFPVIFDRTIKPYILVLALIFTVAFLAGVLTPSPTREDLTNAFQVFDENYRGLGGGKLFFTIFLDNVVATIFMLISGISIGIIPTLAIGANGFVLGVVYRQAAVMVGYSKAALLVLPHGVFELPALLIAASYGLWIGILMVRRM
jgi:stage II sporulation protein M